MRMDTDRLIHTLAADNAHRERPVALMLAISLLVAAPFSLAMFFMELGVRPDVDDSDAQSVLRSEIPGDAGAGISAIAISLHLSRPEVSTRALDVAAADSGRAARLGIVGEMMMPQRLPMMTRLVGSNSRICMTAIPLLSLPLLAAALIGLRHGAPARPRWPARSPDCCRRDWRRRCTPRIAPTIRRCSSRPGTRSRPRWSPPSARWRGRGCCGFRLASSRGAVVPRTQRSA